MSFKVSVLPSTSKKVSEDEDRCAGFTCGFFGVVQSKSLLENDLSKYVDVDLLQFHNLQDSASNGDIEFRLHNDPVLLVVGF